MEKLKKTIWTFLWWFLLPFCRVNRSKIVFINFNGQGYGCNPKYVAEELIRERVPCELVWLVHDLSTDLPEKIQKIQYGSKRAKYELYTAGVWVSNVRNDQGIKKRKSQFYIQTWHASYSLKLVEKDALKKLGLIGERIEKESKHDGQMTDLFLSNSKMQTDEIRKSFWYNGRILEKGLPRNDILLSRDREMIATKVRRKLGLKEAEKVVLFAPTFRDDHSTPFMVNFERLLQNISCLYNSTCKLLLRLHPNDVQNGFFSDRAFDGVMDVSSYPDVQELLLVSDMLITDYSTSVFDFTLLDRDIIIFAPDVEKYKRKRGLKPVFDQLPYPKAFNEEQLEEIIRNYNLRGQKVRNRQMNEWYGSYDEGEASQAVCSEILSYIQKGKSQTNG